MALDGSGGSGDAGGMGGGPPGAGGQSGAGQSGGLIGRTLGGYRLVGLLGVGGMAEVYRAQDAGLHREVAVKVLPSALARDASYVARFRKEAERTAAFTHPNVVPVYGYGEEGGLLYLVMPVLASSVRDRLERGGALDPMEAARLAYQVAAALDAAHRRGLVHRDVKPENILLGPDGRAMLTDFGIARELDVLQSNTGTQTLSVTGLPVGTPEYMAPEQLRGQPLDQRIDIYSLGIVFFEMLTGQVPFDAETPYAVAARVLKEDVPLPSSLNPRVWPALDLVVHNAVARDPDERYPNMRSFAMDIRTAASRAGRSHSRWIALERTSQPIVDATRLTPSAAEHSQPLSLAPGPNSRPNAGPNSRPNIGEGPNSGPYWGLNTAMLPAPTSAPMYVPGGGQSTTPNYAAAPVSGPIHGAAGYGAAGYGTAGYGMAGIGMAGYARAGAAGEQERNRGRFSLPVIAAILLAVLVLGAIGVVVLLHGLGAGKSPTTPSAHATGTIVGTPGHQVATHPSGTGTQPTATTAAQATITPGGPTATPGSPTPTATSATPQITLATSSVTLVANSGACTGTQTMTNDGTVPATWSWPNAPTAPTKDWSYAVSGTMLDPTSGNTLAQGNSVTVQISYNKPCTGRNTSVNVTVANGSASPGSFKLTY